MKAKEYVDKYYENLTSKDKNISLAASKELVKDFIIDEPNALIQARKVKFDRGAIPIFKELNQKWFALCKQMEQKFGSPVLNKNAFRDFWVEQIPELSGKL